MSQGNAAAVRRRVKNIEPPRPGSSNDLNATSTQSPSSNPANLSISDAFKLVNERLVNLEKGVGAQIEPQYSSNLSEEIVSEYEERFKVIAQEIGELKDVVYKLQTFTMDVNKALYDERVKILGDIDKHKDEIINIESLEGDLSTEKEQNITVESLEGA